MPTLFNSTTRQGEYVSTTYTLPNDPPNDAQGKVETRLNIPNTADYEDPLNTVTLTREVLMDDGSWFGDPRTWTGGRRFAKDGTVNPTPTFIFDLLPYANRQVRARLLVPRSMAVGVDITVI